MSVLNSRDRWNHSGSLYYKPAYGLTHAHGDQRQTDTNRITMPVYLPFSWSTYANCVSMFLLAVCRHIEVDSLTQCTHTHLNSTLKTALLNNVDRWTALSQLLSCKSKMNRMKKRDFRHSTGFQFLETSPGKDKHVHAHTHRGLEK